MTVVVEHQLSRADLAWITRRMRATIASYLPDVPTAACKGAANPDLWHPKRPNRRQEYAAIAICRNCPVITECLDFALRAHPVDGIWGGTTREMRDFLADEHISVSVR